MDLFVSDLDGTLLDRDARLDPFVRDRLNELIDAGLRFTVASARSVFSIGTILEGLQLRLPVVEFNGGCVSDIATQQSLLTHDIERGIAQMVGRLGPSAGVTPIYSCRQEGNQWVYVPSEDLNDGETWYRVDREKVGDPRVRDALPEARLPPGLVIAITFIALESTLRPLQEAVTRLDPTLETHLFPNAYSPGWHWLSVHPKAASKGNAIRWLAAREGIDIGRVTVFGDALNDLSMFQAAGRSIAVANAHPELKQAATGEIGPHHEHSVLAYLEQVMDRA